MKFENTITPYSMLRMLEKVGETKPNSFKYEEKVWSRQILRLYLIEGCISFESSLKRSS